MREPDAAFAEPQWARLYDAFESDRVDLIHYRAIAAELEARTVIDVGCGTGVLALGLADDGCQVIGLDPALASLDVARAKPGAERVNWVHGDAHELRGLHPQADLALMTGNVAQVFVSDQDWSDTLDAIHASLRPGGWLVFETRRPAQRAWRSWDGSTTLTLPDGRSATQTYLVTSEELPLVSFESTITVGDLVLRSASTLRFRDRDEITADLYTRGFAVSEVRQAPDRPGLEFVFLAHKTT